MTNTYDLIAVTYKDEIINAIFAHRMGQYEVKSALIDKIISETGFELWEVIEAIHIINESEFDGETVAEAIEKKEKARYYADKAEKEKAGKNQAAIIANSGNPEQREKTDRIIDKLLAAHDECL